MTAPVSRLSNSFTMANAIVDLDLRHMSGNALKCYVVIVRKTTGWNKVTDRISIRQFMDFSGIERRETVSKALRELEAMGLIVRHERSGRITEYSLNFEEPTHTDKPSYPDEPTHSEKPSDTHTDKPSDTPPKKPYTTKDTVTKPTVTKDTRLGARATADDDQPKFSDPPPEPPPHARPKRKQPLPDDFTVTDTMRAWFAAQGFSFALQGEHERFCDYWRGRGEPMKDWEAVWRNWMRKAADFAKPKPQAQRPSGHDLSRMDYGETRIPKDVDWLQGV